MEESEKANDKTQYKGREELKIIFKQLAEPFPAECVKFKPQVVSGNKALAVPYIDARSVADRLDEVVGQENWKDSYSVMTDSTVICKLSLRINGEWITKEDAGVTSKKSDDYGPKGAFSDAFKRAAIKWGIGRYIYRLPKQWADYDEKKRRFVKDPTLPTYATRKEERRPEEHKQFPQNGQEFFDRLKKHDAKLTADGLCNAGSLHNFVFRQAAENNFPNDLNQWTKEQIRTAIEWAKTFESKLRKR
jgi:hypothetical protein